jgi:hypothetical protein
MLDKPMATLSLDELQQDLLTREVRAFVYGLADPEAQARYTGLLRAVESGEISEEHLDPLAGLLAVVLESGRVRALHGPAGENALLSLFQKTPQGAALAQMANAVNQALTGLERQVLAGITFRSTGPGTWALTLQTDRCELTMRIDRRGIQVENLGVDLG